MKSQIHFFMVLLHLIDLLGRMIVRLNDFPQKLFAYSNLPESERFSVILDRQDRHFFDVCIRTRVENLDLDLSN